MPVIHFEQQDSVGHIVLANPPKNLIASDSSNALKQAEERRLSRGMTKTS